MLPTASSLFLITPISAISTQENKKTKTQTDGIIQKLNHKLMNFLFKPSTQGCCSAKTVKQKASTSGIYALFCKSLCEVIKSCRSNTHFPAPLLTLIAEYREEMTSPLCSLRRDFVSSIGFGKEMWSNYFGDIGEVPRLPENICAILDESCPFTKGKKVAETHLLVLIPQMLEGTPLSLHRFGELVQNITKTYLDVDKEIDNEITNKPFHASHWVLITKDVLEESRKMSYQTQQSICKSHPLYMIPRVNEVVVATFIEYLLTGVCLFNREQWTYTRCLDQCANEQLIVGGFSPSSLYIGISGEDHKQNGIALLRKF